MRSLCFGRGGCDKLCRLSARAYEDKSIKCKPFGVRVSRLCTRILHRLDGTFCMHNLPGRVYVARSNI